MSEEQAWVASLTPEALRTEMEATAERMQQILKDLILLETHVMELLDVTIAALPRSNSE